MSGAVSGLLGLTKADVQGLGFRVKDLGLRFRAYLGLRCIGNRDTGGGVVRGT